jgi:formylmethanofuran dehydrogenase subunit E
MSCQFAAEIIEKTIDFHGHYCPGLAIGIRAAELAIKELGDPGQIHLVTVSETDMCGVDAIQFLTGCTCGKGNLLHRDLGKMAFNFFDRGSGRGLRVALRGEAKRVLDEDLMVLSARVASGTASESERSQVGELREALKQRFMTEPLSELFSVSAPQMSMPRPPQVLLSMVCDSCGEGVMESRTRRFQGKTLCIPCFDAVEQKL